MSLVIYNDSNLGEILRTKPSHVPHKEKLEIISKSIKTTCKVWTINTYHHEKHLVSITAKSLSTLIRSCKPNVFALKWMSIHGSKTNRQWTLLPQISKSMYICACRQILFSIDIVCTIPFEILVLKYPPPFSYGRLVGVCP